MSKAKRLPESAGQAPDHAALRMARRARRHDLSREEILTAARQVLMRGGVAATTLDAVAKEVGMSKAALYYYYPSKDAMLFELVFGAIENQARSVHDAVEQTTDGAAALSALIRETVQAFAPRLDDFRLAFLHGQVAGPGAVHWSSAQFDRIRPLNEMCLAGTARRLSTKRGKKKAAAAPAIEPRLLTFLAYLAAIGVLTMKGMVESLDDPLVYSDEMLIEGMAKVFQAAAVA